MGMKDWVLKNQQKIKHRQDRCIIRGLEHVTFRGTCNDILELSVNCINAATAKMILLIFQTDMG